GHDRAHVHLVEGGQQGGGVLGLLQAPGDGLAQAAHPHALLALVQGPRRGGGGGLGRRLGAGLEGGQGVALGDPAAAAGAGDGGGVQLVLGRDPLGGRGDDRRRSGRAGRGGVVLQRRGGRRRLAGGRLGLQLAGRDSRRRRGLRSLRGGRGGRLGRRSAFGHSADQGAGLHRRAFLG